jgi:DNA repair protein RadA/Sms
MVVIDSIQTLTTSIIESSAGSISQIRETATELQRYSKQSNIPVVLIGHIIKDGTLAGPKLLEHMVDAVLQFEGDRNYGYRILRSMKNRFGSTSELGIFEMRDTGLREVSNPSELLLSQRDEQYSGIAVAATLEGMRPMLIEVQALVSSAAYGTPQRSATGFDLRRLGMLLAVLEKRCGFRLGAKDVFLNIAGGIKVDDPAIDLAVVSAVLSSGEDVPIAEKVCFAAEVGLSGEIRPVSRVEQRVSEADKLGFDKIIVSKFNSKEIDRKKYRIQIIPVSKIEEVFNVLFR